MEKLMRALKLGTGVVVLLGLALCALVNLGRAPGRGEAEATNRRAADQVVSALTSYKNAHGTFPEQLQQLVPDPLASLPALVPASMTLSYERVDNGADFVLSYPETPMGMLPADAEHHYQASRGGWENKVY